MTLERVGALFPFLFVLVVPAWSAWRMARGLSSGTWRRPGWFGHVAGFFLYTTVVSWLWGFFATGLDREKTCRFVHHQPYDEAYYEAHREEFYRIFPQSAKCHADYELVPAWVNPAVAVCFVLFLASLTGFIWAVAARRHSAAEGGIPS